MDISSSNLSQGIEQLRAGQFSEAIEYLVASVRAEPGRLAAVRALTAAYLVSGNQAAARQTMELFVEDHPMNAGGWRLASLLEWKLGRRERAVEVIGRGMAKLPGSALLRNQLATFLSAQGKPSEAREQISDAEAGNSCSRLGAIIRTNTPNEVHINSTLREADPSADDAGDDWLNRVAQTPRLIEAVLETAEPGSQQTILVQLANRMERLMADQPNHADRWVMLARLWMKLDRDDQAMAAVRRARLVNPYFIEAHRTEARLQAKSGQFDKAIETLKSLLKRGLAWADIHYEIAELEHKQGRSQTARGHLYEALTLNPKFKKAGDLLRKCAA